MEVNTVNFEQHYDSYNQEQDQIIQNCMFNNQVNRIERLYVSNSALSAMKSYPECILQSRANPSLTTSFHNTDYKYEALQEQKWSLEASLLSDIEVPPFGPTTSRDTALAITTSISDQSIALDLRNKMRNQYLQMNLVYWCTRQRKKRRRISFLSDLKSQKEDLRSHLTNSWKTRLREWLARVTLRRC